MAQNIELKAKVADRAALQQKVEALAGKIVQQLVQRDVYYGIKSGRLKYRTINNKEHQIIFYRRPDTTEAKKSTFYKYNLWFPAFTHGLIKILFGQKGIVNKVRILYMIENIRIHLDEVKGMGNYIEFEYLVDATHTEAMGKKRLQVLKEELGIPENSILSHSYIDILAQGSS